MTTSNYSMPTTKDTKDMTDGLSGQLKGVIESGQEKLGDVKDKIVGAKDVVVEKTESIVTMMSKTIKAHPFKTVGAAIGISYLVTRIIHR